MGLGLTACSLGADRDCTLTTGSAAFSVGAQPMASEASKARMEHLVMLHSIYKLSFFGISLLQECAPFTSFRCESKHFAES